MALVITILILYILVMGFCCIQWVLIPKVSDDSPPDTAFSVIIPFRNEASNLPALISSLKYLDYPQNLVEFIFVDDHSTDNSNAIVGEFCENVENAHWMTNSNQGKKSALTTGISNANFRWIVTLDADCTVPTRWLWYFNRESIVQNTHLLAGAITLKNPTSSFIGMFQQFEQTALTGVGGITMTAGYPTMCNGANLCFRKDAFYQVGGYEGNEEIASGDDQFLLKKISDTFPGTCRFIKNIHHHVTTNAAPSWGQLLQQRIRWAGKWKASGGTVACLSVGVALLYLVVPFALVMAITMKSPTLLFLILVKWLVDALFVLLVQGRLTGSIFLSPVFQLFYPIYMVQVLVGLLRGQYEWKERRYSTVER